MTPSRLILHHVPRTGGSYITGVLRKCLGPEKVHVVSNDSLDAGRRRIAENPDALVFVSHFAFHPDVFEARGDEFWFTVIRDPAEMAYSAWGHWGRNKSGPAKMMPRFLEGQVRRTHDHDTLADYIQAVLDSDESFFPMGAFTGLERIPEIFDQDNQAWWLPMLPAVLGHDLRSEHVRADWNTSGVSHTYRVRDVMDRLGVAYDQICELLCY